MIGSIAKNLSSAVGFLKGPQATEDLTELIPDVAIKDPQQDRLGLVAVAETLVELISRADTPVNVAVFGAWGSGKTSLAKLLELSLTTAANVRYVYINAWKYSETPLRRHFLAGAGAGLGETSAFADRLYSKSRTTKYSFTKRTVGVALAIAALAFLLAVAILAVAQVLIWLPSRTDDYLAMLGRSIAANAGALLISTSLLSPLLTFVVNEMKVELDEDEPSSAEQFDKLFAKLVRDHMPDGGRLVFFVDELDRARAPQMQEVLETLKTFLDQPGCVFVVAADQVVLEEAISKTDKTTVHGQGNPYYSGGSAYLDKVFQFQIQLPAIEAPALTRFALDLVETRPGVWTTLGEDRGDVVSILVPNHVRSPRRVKVLLNNFVLAARVAGYRLGGSLEGEDLRQLAKLVCLRTEFPLFFRDVESNPALLDAVTAHVMGDEGRVNDYTASPELTKLAKAYADGRIRVDVRLAPSDGAAAEADKSATDQLRDYLRRSRAIAVTNYSLIYLRPPGSQLGLDASIARLVQDAARNGDADAAVASLRGADAGTIAKAVDLLILALDAAIGVEISNVLDVLLEVAKEHAAVLPARQAGAILNLVYEQRVWARLTARQVQACLVLNSMLQEGERVHGEESLIGRTSEGDEWKLELLVCSSYLTDSGKEQSRVALSDLVAGGSDVALDFARQGSEPVVRELWEGRPIDLLGSILADPGAMQSRHLAIAEALSPRLEQAARWSLLLPALNGGDETRITQLKPLVDGLSGASNGTQCDAVLVAVAASPRLLSTLGRLLPAEPSSASQEILERALSALVVYSGLSDAQLAVVRAGSTRLQGVLTGTVLTDTGLVEAMGESWEEDWSADEATAIRGREHRALVSISKAAPSRATTFADVIVTSITGALGSPVIPRACRDEIVSQIQSWGSTRPSQSRTNELFDLFAQVRTPSAADTFTEATRRYCLFLTAELIESLTDTQRSTLRTEVPTSGARGSIGAVCISLYLKLCRPKFADEQAAVLAGARLADDPVSGPHSKAYFEELREPVILSLLIAIHASGERLKPALRASLAVNGDQLAWAKYFAQRLAGASTVSDRKTTWEFVSSLRLESKKAVSVALEAALEAMTGTSGSLNDLLAELPEAFPGWTPSKKTLKVIEKAESKFASNSWTKKARVGLDRLLRR